MMHGIARTELQAMLEQLDQAIQNHLRWHESLARILICRLPFDPRQASPDAHRECAFGVWYYNSASAKLRAEPAFIAIETQHREMHELAAALLHESAGSTGIAADDYDHFTRRMGQFRLELETLKREIEMALGNLDPLTGANNRIGMLGWLRAQQELVKRNILPCSLAMIDLDHFKLVNDTYGHLTGDAVLAAVARYLIDHMRPYDKLYRFGGEEFLLCMQGVDLDTTYCMVDRLRNGLADSPIAVGNALIPCCISCGVALLEADQPVEQAIEHADTALYAAKAGGRNRTQAWDRLMA